VLTVILNPGSGAGGMAASRLEELFRVEDIEIKTVTLVAGRAEAMIREAVDTSAGDAVVAAGGDGTVSSVAAVLAGGSTPLGVLPVGTLNHFARDLRIPVDMVQAIRTIVARHTASVDVGYVNDRAFINNASIGVYPGIVERREELKRQGRNKWAALAMATATILQRNRDVFLRLQIDGRDVVTRTPFLFVGNNEYLVEGLQLGGRARLDGGRLYAYLAPRLHTRELPRLLLWALAGRVRKHGAFATFAASDISIDTPRQRSITVAIDGEISSLVTPLRFRVAHGALKVIVPSR
jgi:diacylglycerol kinase family enzyme